VDRAKLRWTKRRIIKN